MSNKNVGPDEELGEESIIPEEDFREAIDACRQDPMLDLYFKMAPRGAKLFIGLSFYSTHFGDKVDPRQYAVCQAEIEPALAITDLTYLIRFERDKVTKKYLRELLARRKAELASGMIEPVAPPPPVPAPPEPPPPPAPAVPDDEPTVPPKPAIRPQPAPATPTLLSETPEKEDEAKIPVPVKIAAAAAILLVVALAVYFSQRTTERPPERPQAQVAETADLADMRARALARLSRTGKRQPVDGVRVEDMQFEEEPPITRADEEEEAPQGAEPPSAPAPSAAGAETVAESPRPRGNAVRVVLTDGKKIVRRPGGVVEVPRVFSCAGAGVKPFWVYGAHPEAEAAKEMKAREEWQALVLQAEKGSQ